MSSRAPRPRPARVLTTALAVLLLAAFSGCGPFGGDSPEDVIKDFGEALADGDGEKACDLLTDDYREEEFAGDECEERVEQFAEDASDEDKDEVRNVEVFDVEEEDDTATAKVKSEGEDDDEADTVEFEKVDGDWKISGSEGS